MHDEASKRSAALRRVKPYGGSLVSGATGAPNAASPMESHPARIAPRSEPSRVGYIDVNSARSTFVLSPTTANRTPLR